jgi:hypothetical protein
MGLVPQVVYGRTTMWQMNMRATKICECLYENGKLSLELLLLG